MENIILISMYKFIKNNKVYEIIMKSLKYIINK